MYKARVYQIMIGAPSDIKEEVDIVKNVVNKWNDLNSEKEKIVLIPKYWASSTYPMAGVRPQESINRQIVDKSDLLICMFGARLGEPTGKALSGSIEEVNEHMKAKKPVMVFFKKSGSYDIDPAQLQKVKDYRERIQEKVLWVDYRDAKEFANIIGDKLQLFLNDNWLRTDADDDLQDEERLRSADRAIGIVHNLTSFNEFVNATNVLFDNLENVCKCKDKNRASKTIDLIQDYLLEIYRARTAEGKCRVTEGRREKYVKLLTQIGGNKAAQIVEYLHKAQEVSENFKEMDDLFDEKIEAKIEEAKPKWENVD